jgi:hypothetical protein
VPGALPRLRDAERTRRPPGWCAAVAGVSSAGSLDLHSSCALGHGAKPCSSGLRSVPYPCGGAVTSACGGEWSAFWDMTGGVLDTRRRQVQDCIPAAARGCP